MRELHRVKIKIPKSTVKCPIRSDCNKVENCYRCNDYYKKCSLYKKRLENNEF